jgi:microcystin-dependent protein
MTDPFVGEIRIFAGNFAPTGWALCDGQLLPISQNTALFSLLGTYYGGDGKSTFGLPNLQGCVPIGQGQGAGLTDRFIGETAGEASLTLITSEMPNHVHTMTGETLANANLKTPSAAVTLAKLPAGSNLYQSTTNANLVQMAPQALSVAGGGLPHNNMQPYLTLVFIIAMQGVFPPRS